MDIVAYVTKRGRLFCAKCRHVDYIEDEKYWDGSAKASDVPVYKDSNPHAFEVCDDCGRVVNEPVKGD